MAVVERAESDVVPELGVPLSRNFSYLDRWKESLL